MLQESSLAGAALQTTRSRAHSRRIRDLLYACWFLPVFFVIRLLTMIMALVRFNRAVRAVNRVAGLRKKVLYLEAFFPENAGFHYRTQKWIELLRTNGFEARVKYVFAKEPFERMLSRGDMTRFQSVFMLRRIWDCLASLRFNCVIVRRELLLFNDYGGLFLDKFLLALHPNVILDFDDDLAAAKREPREITSFGKLMFENGEKFRDSLKLYGRFIAGSRYLNRMISHENAGNAITVPTCVDYEQYPVKTYDDRREYIDFGWVGSATNHYLLEIVLPVLSEVAKSHKIRFVLITSAGFEANVDFEVVHLPWSLETEIECLSRIDIGLMPLYDNAQERGKCGFKLIQYMGLGIVSIASAVTANCEIVDDGENGFLVSEEQDWLRVIEQVLARRAEFPRIGAAAREKIRSQFSFEANQSKYLEFISRA